MLNSSEKIAWVLAAVSCAGCTFVYDGDVFERADAAPDIDPAALTIESIEPTQVFEGQGIGETSRAIPILISGTNIAPDARIAVSGPGIEFDVVAQTAANGTMAAFTIEVPVDTDFGSMDGTATISITVSQGAVNDSISLDLVGLDELNVTAGPLQLNTLAPRYSQIQIDGAVELVGDIPARFVATDSITVSGVLSADATGDGNNAGGRPGGEPGTPATGGGGAGGDQSGGGGGGNKESGGAGQGGDGGVVGPASEATLLSPLAQAAGGGGGGGGGGLSAGRGGGGGGVIELRGGGDVIVDATGRLSADGADGANGGALCSTGGAGGGGAGGGLLVRSETKVTINGILSVAPGVKGTAGTGGIACAGGDGSLGQIRIDAPTLDGKAPQSRRGPSWLPSSVPAIVTSPALDATLMGAIGETYFIEVNGVEGPIVQPTGPNETVPLSLSPGINQVCALVIKEANPSQSEALNCVSIIYLAP